ncbi:Gfo/Idh/MocA family protein [Paenibacillus sp. MBLB4367]|uniref:Gfo/Idh/MocA family protein n=1 Tax=Paenibacillus sp. MBLB4367 TaxID=3384767 RepID=UPI003907F84E
MAKKRYALVGTGGRSHMFINAIARNYKETSELVAFCDVNQTRMDYANRLLEREHGLDPIPTYKEDRFDEMIRTEKPDVVIVTTVDRTHHTYIIRAMELGCDAISEKPMTVDEEKCQAILDTTRRTGRSLRVTFNYRYAPHNTKIRELIMDGAIGDVFSVHFEWLLNTRHGADYFRRWHRDKANSGGLLVHKSTHHFDLVNFWLGSQPKSVFAMGGLNFYGRENAEKRGVTQFYERAHGSEAAKDDHFAIHLEKNDKLKELYLDAEHEDGYIRDQSVFGEGITIEDTLGVMVRYRSNAILTYSLNAYLPWEGYRVVFNGSKGRMEVNIVEASHIIAAGRSEDDGKVKDKSITVYPMFEAPYEVDIPEGVGGHGGGDRVMLNDIFGVPGEDRFHRAASHVDGAMSILTGVAGNISIRTGQPVNVDELVKF